MHGQTYGQEQVQGASHLSSNAFSEAWIFHRSDIVNILEIWFWHSPGPEANVARGKQPKGKQMTLHWRKDKNGKLLAAVYCKMGCRETAIRRGMLWAQGREREFQIAQEFAYSSNVQNPVCLPWTGAGPNQIIPEILGLENSISINSYLWADRGVNF